MGVKNQDKLAQLEELILRAEMEVRAAKSIEAIDNNDIVSLADFTKKNKAWLEKKASK